VLYVGTFSKSMVPTVRTGFVLAPPSLRPSLVAARQLGGWHGQVAVQAALARFIEDGHLARHVRRARKAYAERHARIVAVLGAQESLEIIPSAAGLHVTALLRHGRSAPIVRAAREQGIAVEDLADYATASTGAATGDTGPGAATAQAGFVLGFGAVDPATIEEGLTRFAALLSRTAAD
jgi:GntR family transcriptional regulator/MocR family aminotransferase